MSKKPEEFDALNAQADHCERAHDDHGSDVVEDGRKQHGHQAVKPQQFSWVAL